MSAQTATASSEADGGFASERREADSSLQTAAGGARQSVGTKRSLEDSQSIGEGRPLQGEKKRRAKRKAKTGSAGLCADSLQSHEERNSVDASSLSESSADSGEHCTQAFSVSRGKEHQQQDRHSDQRSDRHSDQQQQDQHRPEQGQEQQEQDEAMEMSSAEEMDVSEGEDASTQTVAPTAAAECTYIAASAQSNLQSSQFVGISGGARVPLRCGGLKNARRNTARGATANSEAASSSSSSRGSSPESAFRRERRSPSYGEYRGHARSSSSSSRSFSDEESEADGECEEEKRSLFSTGEKLDSLLTQQVEVQVVGGSEADRKRLAEVTSFRGVRRTDTGEPDFDADELAACAGVLHEKVVQNLRRLGCRLLLPIQRFAFSAVGTGFDVCGAAATGSGKTLAFLAPLASRVIAQRDILPRPYFAGSHACASPLGMILCPTRELALQIQEQLEEITAGTDLRWSLWVGGVSSTEQLAQINRTQIDVVVGTAGRVDELCLRGKASLEFLQVLVLDEADAMLDLGFRDAMTELALNRGAPASRQTLLFSATFPAKLGSLLSVFLKKPYVRLTVGGATKTNSQSEEAPIAQTVKFVSLDGKFTELLSDIAAFRASPAASGENAGRQTMVFVGSKRATRELSGKLGGFGVHAEALHGALSQEERQRIFKEFRAGKIDVLVTTSVAARGLDFPNVGLVVNYDLPPTIEVYIHRIGRTGRAGRAGASISYFTNKDYGIADALARHLRKCRQDVPSFLFQGQSRNSRV